MHIPMKILATGLSGRTDHSWKWSTGLTKDQILYLTNCLFATTVSSLTNGCNITRFSVVPLRRLRALSLLTWSDRACGSSGPIYFPTTPHWLTLVANICSRFKCMCMYHWSQQNPGGGLLGSSFAGYVPLSSQNPHPIIVYSVANYRPHPSHFWANVIVISRTEFNASRMLNIKTTAGTIFQPRIFLFLNPCLSEFSYPKNPENLRPHSCNSTKNVTPL